MNEPEALHGLWPHLPFGSRAAKDPVVERLYSVLFAHQSRTSGVRRFHVLYRDVVRLARTEHKDRVLEALESDLQLYVAEHARRRIFVHAGVVGWKGAAIIIPGRSFSGKSTLVAEFVRAGATYYSDEYAVFDSGGCVHAYSKPLSLRGNGSIRLPSEVAGDAAIRIGSRPLRVALILVCRYRSSARWKPRSVSAAQGALALLANTVAARSRPEAALSALGRAVGQAQVLKGVRGEAADVVRAVLM